MLNCSQFTIHRFKRYIKNYDEPINLYVFGDVHRFAKGCSVEKWQAFLDVARHDKNALFLGMGDYDDMASTSERAILINPGLHDDTRWSIDDIYENRIKEFAKEISFMRNNIIGLIEGNHYGIFSTGGMTTTQYLCNHMRCFYLGVNGFVRLSFSQIKRPNSRFSIDIFAHHGRGAARLIGSSLNNVEQMVSTAEADIYCMGHDHKLNAAKISRLHLVNGGDKLQLKDKTMLLARSGSFLRGYIPDHQSYVVRGAMKPAEIGYLKITLTPQRIKKANKESYNVKIEVTL